MKNIPLIGQKLIQLFENSIRDFDHIQELRTKFPKQSRVEIIKKIGTLSPEHRAIFAASMKLTVNQVNAIFQIYCSEFIKNQMKKGQYMLPTLINNNILIDLSKRWFILNYDGNKYSLSNKTVCTDCIDKGSCASHTGFMESSKEKIALNLGLEVYELEEALIMAEK